MTTHQKPVKILLIQKLEHAPENTKFKFVYNGKKKILCSQNYISYHGPWLKKILTLAAPNSCSYSWRASTHLKCDCYDSFIKLYTLV